MCTLLVFVALHYYFTTRSPPSALITEAMASDKSYIFVIIGAMLSVSAMVISIVCVIIVQKRKLTRQKRTASQIQSREVDAPPSERGEVTTSPEPLQ
jgi:mannitol-specific phosphotransferase system IIBC component